MYDSGLSQQKAIAELPALGNFVSKFQKAHEELNSLNSRLGSVANKLQSEPPQENKQSVPMQPRQLIF